MSDFFGDFINQQGTRTMGLLQGLGVGVAASTQANAIGYASSLISQLVSGANIQHGRYVYNQSALAISSAKIPVMEYSGVVPDVQGGIPPQYMVTIQNSYNKVIRATLQESFMMSTTSDWIPFLNPKISDNLVKLGALFHMSLFPRFASRRVWRGTSPIQMKLRLKFEAVNNSWQEVVLPCLRLMQMSLPGEGGIKPFQRFGSSFTIPVLEPPGPSPFMLNEDVKTNFETGNLTSFTNRLNQIVVSGSDQIRIKIGRLVEFNNVIVESVQVEYLNKFGSDGKPVGARVEITFSTYEIYTKEAIEESHNPQG